MAQLVPVTRQQDSLQGFQIAAPEDMMTALAYLAAGGYTGHINCASSNGAPVWAMGLQSPGQTVSQSAEIGDWIVIKNNATATVVAATQFDSLYAVSQ